VTNYGRLCRCPAAGVWVVNQVHACSCSCCDGDSMVDSADALAGMCSNVCLLTVSGLAVVEC
jgi:hypothetical protein